MDNHHHHQATLKTQHNHSYLSALDEKVYLEKLSDLQGSDWKHRELEEAELCVSIIITNNMFWSGHDGEKNTHLING